MYATANLPINKLVMVRNKFVYYSDYCFDSRINICKLPAVIIALESKYNMQL